MAIAIPDFNTSAVINGNTLIAQADEQLNILMDDVKEYVESTYDSVASGITAITAADVASALASKNAAASSATSAASSATSAASSATSAASSAAAALVSKNAAATSATSAATSATNSQSSSTSAASSATSAVSSATSAASSATSAASSATSATSSAAAALVSKNAAATSATSAAALYDSFDDRYLGVKSLDPTTDNDGDALLVGALYFNSTSESIRVKTTSGWALISNIDAYTKTEVQNSLPKVGFDLLADTVVSTGQLAWNAEDGTLDLGLPNGSTLQIGQEVTRPVFNNSGVLITNGTACKITGTSGNSGRVYIAQSTGLFNESMYVYGIATQDIPNGFAGIVTVSGKVRGINTTGSLSGETWVDNDVLYIKPNDGGKLTKVVPLDNQLKMPVATVINANSNGALEIRVTPINENATVPRAKILDVPRTISLSGDVTGTVSFDGSANSNIVATIAANSVTLGTDTTGNYVAGNTSGTGITVSGTAGEGWSPTISLSNTGTAGTYRSVTTNAQGQVTAGTNPTTISGYGITDAYTKTEVDTKVANLIDSAPSTLDTLNELAAALGDDPNFATTIATSIGTKVTSNTDITAGTSTKITYDAKGLVTAGTVLASTDIPVLDMSKLTTGTLPVLRGGTGVGTSTGTGSVVLSISPILTTPNIGIAIGTSFNSITDLSSTEPMMNGTVSIGTSTTVARADHIHASDTSKANLASPTFTGTPTAPTALITESSTQLATTAFATPRTSDTGAVVIPAGTTAQRPVSATNGYIRYNSDLLVMEAYINGSWGNIGQESGGDSVDLITDQTISGVKTFTSSPVVPMPTTDTQVANKAYVDYVVANKEILYSGAYGLDWEPTLDTYYRTGEGGYRSIQALMRRCILNTNGSVNYYLDANNSNYKEDGTLATLDGTDGNVMVEIPKFYYKYLYVGTRHTYSISLTPDSGYVVNPAFVKDGIEVPTRYYRAYKGYNLAGKIISRSGVTPTRSLSRTTFRTYAQANGAGWGLVDWNLLYAVQLLLLIELGTFNSQSILGTGNYLGNDYGITTGGTNLLGNNSSMYTVDTYMSYRGIENFYADCWEWIDGVNVSERLVYVNNNLATFADDVYTGDYVSTGITMPVASGSYISNFGNSSKGFIASAVAGSSATYVTDGLWTSTGSRAVIFGGTAHYGLLDGAFCVNAHNAASSVDVSLGGGVSY